MSKKANLLFFLNLWVVYRIYSIHPFMLFSGSICHFYSGIQTNFCFPNFPEAHVKSWHGTKNKKRAVGTVWRQGATPPPSNFDRYINPIQSWGGGISCLPHYYSFLSGFSDLPTPLKRRNRGSKEKQRS